MTKELTNTSDKPITIVYPNGTEVTLDPGEKEKLKGGFEIYGPGDSVRILEVE